MKYKLKINNCTCEMGYQLGMCIHDYLKNKNVDKYCISITLYNKEVYRYMSDACIVDNGRWLDRKKNSCLYFGMSTLELFEKNEGNEKNLVQKYGLNHSDYTFTPGSIPIVLENDQVIGACTVSGMKPEEDHQSILDGYALFMSRE
ncbi:heme-binding protein [Floccifex sp.]|uniref:heme-binding protein n=1 Tax=Floccifex sp. TaxID=2815810 RepID=UPI003F080023